MSAQLFEGAGAHQVYLAFVIMLFFADWAVPVTCFFILYGMVVISMQRRKRDSQFESNRYITSAHSSCSKLGVLLYCPRDSQFESHGPNGRSTKNG